MIRAGPVRSLLRPLSSSVSNTLPKRFATNSALRQVNDSFKNGLWSPKVQPLAVSVYKPSLALVRHYAAIPGTYRDPALEAKWRSGIIKPEIEAAQTSPTSQELAQEEDPDMLAGMRHDVEIIKETFALNEVPKEALNIGLAGVLPYLATASSTVFLAFELHEATVSGTGYLLSGETAESLLNILEPLQIGYGAVILSFIGAIHWGMEWAGYGGHQGYKRYAIGVIAPAVAWPTILMPIEQALITQFLAFSFLYTADSSATVKGWVPPWYSTYRFVLTFIVGTSIVASLIGRGMIAERVGGMPAPTERIMALRKKYPVEESEEVEEEE